jgi:hypothetical protein
MTKRRPAALLLRFKLLSLGRTTLPFFARPPLALAGTPFLLSACGSADSSGSQEDDDDDAATNSDQSSNVADSGDENSSQASDDNDVSEGSDESNSESEDNSSSADEDASASSSSDEDDSASDTAGESSDSATDTGEQESEESDESEESTTSEDDTLGEEVDRANVVVHIEDNLDMAKLQEYAQRYHAISRDLWVASEGQQYVATLTIRDATPDAGNNTVFISTGDIDTSGQSNPWCPDSALACVNWYRDDGPVMYVGGNIPSAVWGHEHGHFAFYLWEEYDEPKCHDCFMAVPAMPKYCDDSNHVLGAQSHEVDDFEGSCWTIITKYYHEDWQRPASDFDPNSLPPDFELTIEDN